MLEYDIYSEFLENKNNIAQGIEILKEIANQYKKDFNIKTYFPSLDPEKYEQSFFEEPPEEFWVEGKVKITSK